MVDEEDATAMGETESAPEAEEERARRRHYTVLLAALGLIIVTGPIIRTLGAEWSVGLTSVLFAAIFMALLIAASRAVVETRRQGWCLYGFAFTWFVLRLGSLLTEHSELLTAAHVAALIMMGYVIVLLLRGLLQVRLVDGETIAAALCAYVLMGVFWSIGYALVEGFHPGSFHLPENVSLDFFGGRGVSYANYFSFVTLTTLGYGDITPKSDLTRMMAYMEAVVGQVFLVVLVARLVGMNVAQALQGEGDRKP
jgi:voltage-gated potassium channel